MQAAAARAMGTALKAAGIHLTTFRRIRAAVCGHRLETIMGVKKTGKGRRKLGQKKRRMRARIRHRKG
jgi:hypothetical protein